MKSKKEAPFKNEFKARTISRGQYAQLVGLDTLHRLHRRFLDDIEDAAREITREHGEKLGHTADWLWECSDLKHLLARLNITVAQPKKRK